MQPVNHSYSLHYFHHLFGLLFIIEGHFLCIFIYKVQIIIQITLFIHKNPRNSVEIFFNSLNEVCMRKTSNERSACILYLVSALFILRFFIVSSKNLLFCTTSVYRFQIPRLLQFLSNVSWAWTIMLKLQLGT